MSIQERGEDVNRLVLPDLDFTLPTTFRLRLSKSSAHQSSSSVDIGGGVATTAKNGLVLITLPGFCWTWN